MIEAIVAFLAMLAQLLQPAPPAPVYAHTITGKASWYQSGTVTACQGQWHDFDPDGITLALVDFSRDLCGTEAKVEWQGHVVYATITDHMPDNDRGRVADLSRGLKNALGCPDVANVTISY
jgi:hypothetical protein